MAKISIGELNRNKRAQKNAKFADKKIPLTRRAILARVGKFEFDPTFLNEKFKEPDSSIKTKYDRKIQYLKEKLENIMKFNSRDDVIEEFKLKLAVQEDNRRVEVERIQKMRRIEYQAFVYIRRKRNNIYLTLTDLRGKVVTTSSSGFFGFKNYARVLPNAAQASAKRINFFLKTAKLSAIAMVVKSKVPAVVFAVIRGFAALGVKVHRLMDRIPIAHNGVKRKKARRR